MQTAFLKPINIKEKLEQWKIKLLITCLTCSLYRNNVCICNEHCVSK